MAPSSPTASSTRTAASTCSPASTRSSAPIRPGSSARSSSSTTPPTTARPRRCGRCGGEIRLIALERRTGKAANDSTLLREAKGAYCLLLNEDSELRPGAAAALLEALEADPEAAAAGASCSTPTAGRFPAPGASPGSAPRSPGALPAPLAHRAERGRADAAGRLGAVERAAGPPRGGGRGRLHGPRLLRLLRRVRLLQAPRRRRLAHASTSPPPRRSTTTSSPPTSRAGLPRIVEFHRNRDLYMRKHHRAAGGAGGPRCSPPGPTPCARSPRRSSPASPARVYWAHARQALLPGRGESIRDCEARRTISSRVFVHAAPPRRPRATRPSTARPARRARRRRTCDQLARVAQVAEPAALLGGEEAGGEQGQRVERARRAIRPSRPASALGRQQQLAERDQAGGDRARPGPGAPTRRGPGRGAG